MEMELVEWMIGESKVVFEKKEFVRKWKQLWDNPKKTLPLWATLNLLEKYKMHGIIIRDKQGLDHQLKPDFSITQASQPPQAPSPLPLPPNQPTPPSTSRQMGQ